MGSCFFALGSDNNQSVTRAAKTDAGRATTRNDDDDDDDDMDGDRMFHAFRVVARRASGMWVKGFELIDACAGGCVWGKQKRCV